jgi:hypothetical protein
VLPVANTLLLLLLLLGGWCGRLAPAVLCCWRLGTWLHQAGRHHMELQPRGALALQQRQVHGDAGTVVVGRALSSMHHDQAHVTSVTHVAFPLAPMY